MTHFAAFQRWQAVCAIAVTCAALLSSPGAIADTQLFAVLSNGQPASIDPHTGAVTPIGNQLGGSNWDVVAAANTLYVQPFGGPASTVLDEVDVTSGQLTTVPHTNIPPGVGISDLTVDPASGRLFAVLSNGQPASIDPHTGAVAPIGNQLGGDDWDVVAAANTLYVQPFGGPASTVLDEVDVTSGQLTTVPHTNIPPGVGISDLTIAETGVSPVTEPTTAFLFLSSLAGLIGFGRRRRSNRAAPPNLP